ncbi:hypothetical protein HH303_18630 [Rhodospirillaceae bacterium KN72]|uniref:SMODS-associating 2TM beta-strand rich effector domain-containing protein n=1 Tax=Pacificispira spongiicola TaxID=2729598 RepID=A0A7Y0E3G8_9PROT|nr:hypothetical protein [Pacificispira spongiicola]NMM46514.1 hypothetical protein [Pacificispira spongiicola]
MFDSIGLAKFLKAMLYINAALAIALATDFFGLLPGMPYVSAASISVIAVSALVFVIGQTGLFTKLCRLPGMWRLFPNIDGEYEIEISSNWSVVKARNEGREPEASSDGDVALFNRVGRATITARLTRIDMSLTMGDGYLTSETVACSLRRNTGERRPVLFYIYESQVPAPKNTDSNRHLGAARVIVPLERRPTVLEGNYWTDRNWHLGLNTAGRIRLCRV